jgi:hypothetical protein
MNNQQWTVIKRVVRYESDYFFRKFQFLESLVFLVSIISIVITGLGDTQSFFISENSPIPTTWSFLKNPKTVLFVSICVLVLPVVCVWYLDQKQKRKDNIELLKTIKENVVPGINLALNELRTTIKKRFHLKGNIRISLWIPVKKAVLNGKFKWYVKRRIFQIKNLKHVLIYKKE